MKYLWTEDTGAGLHFWKLVNQFFFESTLVIESKESNQGILDALSDLCIKEDDAYYIAFDYVVDNQDIRNKYRILKSIAEKSEGKIIILDMICFEHLILAFDKLVEWTGTGKEDKIKIREEVLSAIENHRINLSKINDEKTLQYIAGFKRYSTERVMKSHPALFQLREAGNASILLYYGGKIMRAKAVTADEQYRLIMECRASGMTDYQWCVEHNIKPGTFYNWVKRLRLYRHEALD